MLKVLGTKVTMCPVFSGEGSSGAYLHDRRGGTVILSGTGREDSVPPDMYGRLTADLRTAGCTVVVDLAGERLNGVLEGTRSRDAC